MAPWLLELPGVGPISAAQVLVIWSHAGRLRSEAAFAAPAGANPDPGVLKTGDQASTEPVGRPQRHDLIEGSAGVHLQPRATWQQRLDRLLEGKDPSDLIRVPAVGIGGPGGQPLNEHRGGRGQQHDVVKLRVELPLIRRAAAQEQHLGVLAGQQRLDAVLSPHPVLPGTKAGWLVQEDGYPFGEPMVIGVDGLVAACGQLLITVDFPVPDSPVSSTRFITTTQPLAGAGSSTEQAATLCLDPYVGWSEIGEV